MANKVLGVLILLGVIAVGLYLSFNTGGSGSVDPADLTTLQALVGGEKSKLLRNPKVVEILAKKYGLALESKSAGSLEMVTELPTAGLDLLWPSNQIAVDIFRDRGGQILEAKALFNSPMVIYAWDEVAQAFVQKGLVESRGDIYYLKELKALVELIDAQTPWKDVGLAKLYGKVNLFSTDPTRSNSGNMYAGMVANMLSGGEVARESDMVQLTPRIKSYFQRMGNTETSSGDLFDSFLKTGIGGKPMIIGYESQLVEFSLEFPEYRELLRTRIRTLYPQPTVWSSHPVIALTANGRKLIKAMSDPEIQRIAWEEHGFRSGLMGVQNDPSVLQVVGLPQTIESVMPLPPAAVMEAVIASLKTP